MRHRDDDLKTWHRDGGVLLERFFTPEEMAPCVADMDALYGHQRPDAPAEGLDAHATYRQQFAHTEDVPLDCSPALNLLGLHPALIDLARCALGTDDVRLYQCHTWAKFTGQTDFDQAHHCDYNNHTLTVPSEDPALRTINCMIFLTDVTDAHGAIHYVPLPDSDPITGPERPRIPRDDDVQSQLRAVERSGAGPAGSVFAYGIDVYHRGTNLTAPDGHRYTVTASFKAAGNDQIGWSAWPRTVHQPWSLILDHATPDQLSCLGIPRPGDPYWTELTLRRTAARWPGLDLTPYEAARA